MSRVATIGRSRHPTRPCPLCGPRDVARGDLMPHAAATLLRRLDGAEVSPRPVTCAACGLVFVDPVPEDAVRESTYDAGYYEPWGGAQAASRRRMWRRRLALLRRRQTTGSLLDVGCGDGQFLDAARAVGWRVDGIEFSPEGARRAAARLGRPVAVGDLARTTHLKGPFDVVTLWHVVEHLVDPRALLEAARSRLPPGGLLVVAVPNLDNLPMRLAYRLARGRPLPLYESGWREPHLSHFDPVTLRALLRGAGFDAIEIIPDRCALDLVKRAIDSAAAALGAVTGRLLTDAIVAFSRRTP
jgi:SAM-dependent methyltransferase